MTTTSSACWLAYNDHRRAPTRRSTRPSTLPVIIPSLAFIPLVGPSVKSTVFFFLLLCRSARVVTQAPMAQNRDWVYMLLLVLLEARGNGLAWVVELLPGYALLASPLLVCLVVWVCAGKGGG